MLWLRFLTLFLLPAFVFADGDESLPGHSQHGEAFNDGPRQAAVLMNGMPAITFSITTKKPDAQKFFTQGVAQQHGFAYFEAERSFRQANAIDPDAAMPYWGMAMANVNNEKRAKAFIAKAVGLKSKASKREQLWIETLEHFYREAKDDKRDKRQRQLDYISDLESLVHDFPEDIEAKAFLAWKTWDARKDIPIGSKQAVDALLDQVFAAQPMHPAHHYRIHLWDEAKPIRAVKSGALCGQTAPGIAHMWHMPGHTFSKLGRYDDAAWQQEAATRVDHAYLQRSLVLPDQIHNYAHNEEWLIRTWNEQGRARDGLALATALIRNPRHPTFNTLDKQSSSASYGRTRMLETLLKWELWDELLRVTDSPLFEIATEPGHESARLRARGIAAHEKGDKVNLTASIEALQKLSDGQAAKPKKKEEAKEEIRRAEPAKKDDKPKAEPAKKKPEPKIEAWTAALTELRALVLIKSKPADAMKALEAAKDLPKPRAIRYALACKDTKKASEIAKTAPQDLEGFIAQTEAYAAAKQLDDAKKAFERVRERSYAMDTTLPVIARLDAIAKTLKIDGPWRKPPPKRTDSGQRPALDSLGPVHWSAPAAPDWLAFDAKTKKPLSPNSFKGKPTLLIFYVGHACAHCMDQMRQFETAHGDFAKLGIEVLALSPDKITDAALAHKFAKAKGGFPFPLLSVPSLDTFRAYRAYDDFEKLPLHAVALVDAQQRLRWLDVSFKPFTDTAFLVKEAKRLLALPQGQPVASGN
jgi:peroxiredoxin